MTINQPLTAGDYRALVSKLTTAKTPNEVDKAIKAVMLNGGDAADGPVDAPNDEPVKKLGREVNPLSVPRSELKRLFRK